MKIIISTLLLFAGCSHHGQVNIDLVESQHMNESEYPDNIPPKTYDGVVVVNLTGPGSETHSGRGNGGRYYDISNCEILTTIEPFEDHGVRNTISLYPDPGELDRKVILYYHDKGNWLPYSIELEARLLELQELTGNDFER